MDRLQEYRHYSSEDLVEDSSFWSWVLREEGADDDFWKAFVADNPTKAPVVEMARAKVLQLNRAEFNLPDNRVAALWAKIKQSGHLEVPSEREDKTSLKSCPADSGR